ncbi:MAG TPA: TlpA disulfide reductase family protein [Pyrinomonadaceae bacterium]|nr:TlpA disulfide reductase family protein [Pyrinomonadaceae bacterium]
MRKILVLLALALFLAPVARLAQAQAGHEYAPIQQKTINYRDWTYKNLGDDAPVNLRKLAKQHGTKLLLVVYFAPWCGNWRNEFPVASSLYQKYKANGLNVVGVSEYGTRDEVRTFFGAQGPPFTIVTESEDRAARDQTPHYSYRQSTGDTRRWGSPYNIFLDPKKINKSGDVVAEEAWVVNGELIEADAENFIRKQLGLQPLPAPATPTPSATPSSH